MAPQVTCGIQHNSSDSLELEAPQYTLQAADSEGAYRRDRLPVPDSSAESPNKSEWLCRKVGNSFGVGTYYDARSSTVTTIAEIEPRTWVMGASSIRQVAGMTFRKALERTSTSSGPRDMLRRLVLQLFQRISTIQSQWHYSFQNTSAGCILKQRC